MAKKALVTVGGVLVAAVSGALIFEHARHGGKTPSYDLVPIGAVRRTNSAGSIDAIQGAYSEGVALNDAGDVVVLLKGARAAIWNRGKTTALPGNAREAFCPKAINNLGQVVGFVQSRGGQIAALFDKGRIVKLGSRVGSAATAINDSDEVVGWTEVRVSHFSETHAFRWTYKSGMIDLGPPPPRPFTPMADSGPAGARTKASGINARGDIIGDGMQMFAWQPGLLWRGKNVTALGRVERSGNPRTPFEYWVGVSPAAINNRAQIAGLQTDRGRSKPCVWENGHVHVLKGAGEPRSINDSGVIVGIDDGTATSDMREIPGTRMRRARVWLDGEVYDLNRLIPKTDWILDEAVAVNRSGQILCNAHLTAEGVTGRRAFLLTRRS